MRAFIAGMVLGVALVGCAGFSYKYYGVSLPTQCYQQGTLLGKTAAEDIPLTTCEPDQITKGKCVVMLADEFTRFRQDYKDMEDRLIACEQGFK